MWLAWWQAWRLACRRLLAGSGKALYTSRAFIERLSA